MHIISRRPLIAFYQLHPEVKAQLEAWYFEAKHADWKTPADIIQRYSTASILGDNRVVFNIKGNDCRLIVKIHYNTGIVYIRFVGTHAEYDRIDAETI